MLLLGPLPPAAAGGGGWGTAGTPGMGMGMGEGIEGTLPMSWSGMPTWVPLWSRPTS
jgi:hypothetical protein